MRSRIGYRAWRRLHHLAFAVFGTALVHGLMTGTDTGATPVALMYVVSLALVTGLVLARVLESRAAAGAPDPAPAAAVRAARRAGAADALPPLTPRRPASAGLPPLAPRR